MNKAIFVVAAAIVSAFAFVIFVGYRLSAPVQIPIGDPPDELNAQNVTFGSASGALVHGWFAQAPNAKAVGVLLPGVRANRLSMVDRARFLREAGYSVLLIDLQGTGETIGKQITFGWLESRDVSAAVQYVRRNSPDLPVFLLGTSLGGAAAVLASPLNAEAMVLEAVYPTVEKATGNRLRMRFGHLGERIAPLLLLQLRPRLGVSPAQLRPIELISQLSCPVLFIGGARDKHTTPADTQSMFEQARQPKEVWLVPNAAHVDFHRAATAEYERRVLSFLARSLPAPRSNSALHPTPTAASFSRELYFSACGWRG